MNSPSLKLIVTVTSKKIPQKYFKNTLMLIGFVAFFRSMFVNVETGKLYKSGEYMKRPKLAETLELIALKGPDVLYNGLLTENFIKDIQENGGIITKEDLQNYR